LAAHHQVPSTTHLDSLLVCKAKGMRLRQIVLLQPCIMLHQRHPAPMQPLRYILPGWDLSDSRCDQKASQAAAFLAQGVTTPPPERDTRPANTTTLAEHSMEPNWGFPGEHFQEEV
jgi:hypothetical protein